MPKIIVDLSRLRIDPGEYEVTHVDTHLALAGNIRQTFETLEGVRVYWYYKPTYRNTARMETYRLLLTREEYYLRVAVNNFKIITALYIEKRTRIQLIRRQLWDLRRRLLGQE
jgi:hypothetical protein